MQANSTLSAAQSDHTMFPAIRTWRTSLWLWFVLVANVIAGLFVLYYAVSEGLIQGIDVVAVLVYAAIMDFARAAGAALILRWKIIGFHIVVGAAGVWLLSAPFVGWNILSAAISAVVHVGLIYYVLQYPKENKAWNHLT